MKTLINLFSGAAFSRILCWSILDLAKKIFGW